MKKRKHWKINSHVYLQGHVAPGVLPYVVTHRRWTHGTDWLNETAAETYVPLLSMLNEIVASGRFPRITVGVTPVLSEQLTDD
ncbi:MAG TPA: hypothetical protein EYQ20_16805 [candidate division Zixibacteria bacterium]|nr:hypothetical protein [candidate division Zixibacteria bacterium]